MSISKRGPQSVLVAAILLLMLSSLQCTAMPSARGARRQPCRAASCTYAYLFVKQNNNYDSLVSVYRNGTVNASSRLRNRNSLLRFQTDVSQSASREKEGKLFLHIYNERAKRYICFTRKGKVRTLRKLPRSGRSRHGRLTCRFEERMAQASYNQSHLSTMYVADEGHRRNKKERFISFCRDRVATLRRQPSVRRPQWRHQPARAQRRAGRRDARRRRRQRRAIGRPRQPRRHRPAAKHQRRHNRRRCQHVFMKDLRPN